MSCKSKIFKIGKKLCFPDVPSTWIPRTVETILTSQDLYRRNTNLQESGISSKGEEYQNSCCQRIVTTNLANDVVVSNISTKDAYVWSHDNFSRAYDLLENEHMPENRKYLCPDNKGQTFDVISLLKRTDKGDINDGAYLVRNNGDRVLVESLRGKNILVCCVFVPCFWLSVESNTFRSLFTLHKHWDQKADENSDTEMIVVAKMRRNWGSADGENAFNHFFSGFPSSWLAVPFSDTIRRDHVCNSIRLVDFPRALLVDPNQKVVLHRESYGDNAFHDFCDPENMHFWWQKHTQLDSILDLDSHYVFKTNTNSNTVYISELKEKIVGLYLCIDGSFIRTLDIISQVCKARNQEFEVVLVYLPYKEGVNPPLFQEAINHVLQNLNISNWWVSPFDDFISRRLWEAVEFSEEDELVILDPHMNIADPIAKSVLGSYGINSYPFTREFIVRRELEVISAVTLESLLVYGSRDHLLRIDDDNNVEEVPIAQLRGKIVFLFVDKVENPYPENYHKLLQWYNLTRTTGDADDFEVVFISTTPFSSPKLLPKPMPWLVCPFDLEHTTFLARKVLRANCSGYIVAFGKDGHIITLHGSSFLGTYGPKGFPPYLDLRTDIIDNFYNNHHIEMSGLVDPLTGRLYNYV